MTEKVKSKVQSSANTYMCEQILESKKYREYRDVLGALLERDKSYTTEQIKELLDKFLKEPIKEKINK